MRLLMKLLSWEAILHYLFTHSCLGHGCDQAAGSHQHSLGQAPHPALAAGEEGTTLGGNIKAESGSAVGVGGTSSLGLRGFIRSLQDPHQRSPPGQK